MLELVVRKQSNNYFNDSKYLTNIQYGCPEGLLITIFDNWFNAVKDKRIILAVFIAFNSAFETVIWITLLSKTSNSSISFE